MKETALQLMVAGIMGVEWLCSWMWPPDPEDRLPDPPLYVVAPGDTIHYAGMSRTATKAAVYRTADDARRFVITGDG